jgi:hypothetical protein
MTYLDKMLRRPLIYFTSNLSGNTSPGKKSFSFFSRAPCIIQTTNFSGKPRRLTSGLVRDRQQLVRHNAQWPKTPEAEASLVEEGQ